MNKNKREGRDKMKKIFSLFLAFSLIITSLLVNPNVINYVYADEKPTLLTADFSTGNQNKIPNGVTVTPEFSSQVTEYTVTINPPLRSAVVRTGISLTLQAAENCKIKEVKQQEKLLNVKNGECTIKGLSAKGADYENNKVFVTVASDSDETNTNTYEFSIKLKEDNQLAGIQYYTTNSSKKTSLLDPRFCKEADRKCREYTGEKAIDLPEENDKISFVFSTCDDAVTVKLNGQECENKNKGYQNPAYACTYTFQNLPLEYGKNTFSLVTHRQSDKDNQKDETYTIVVNRAKPLLKFESLEIEDGVIVRNSLVNEGNSVTLDGFTKAIEGSDKTFKLTAKAERGYIVTYDVPATKDSNAYEGKVIDEEHPLILQRPTYERNGQKDYYGRLRMAPTIAKIFVSDATKEDIYTEYNICVYPRMPDGASRVKEALPGPGQFVNGFWGGGIVPDNTLGADINTDNLYNITTLGAFGGYVVYEFDEAIKNDPMNKYGVDFVVYGNSFGKNAAEPAAISVSEDGETWYNLAGSEYYELTTDWKYWVTYKRDAKESGASTRMKSFTAKDGAEKWLQFRTDMYYPINATHKELSGKELGAEYTLTGVCTYSGNGKRPEHAFGYADVSENGDVNPTAISVKNPYIEGAQYMDISWAVDEQGKPVELDKVKYVKATNCMLYTTIAFGEVSPEIGGISKVNASKKKEAVGVTEQPSSIKINDIEYSTVNFSQTSNKIGNFYEIALNDDSIKSLNVSVAGKNKSDNIWINNTKFTGTATRKVLLDKNGARTLRIIVQNGEKEPIIYVFSVTGGGNPADNVDINNIVITPGDRVVEGSEIANNNFVYEVENNVEKVAFKAEALNPNATVLLISEEDAIGEELSEDSHSKTKNLKVGDNSFTFKVTSADKTKTQQYVITIKRKQENTSTDSIKVSFTWTGDKVHGEDGKGNPNPGHEVQTWIPTTTLTVPKGSTVKYVTDMMLYNSRIDFQTDGGTYISQVMHPTEKVWLGEFTNGNNSGWMYRLNGLIADEGYATRVLKNGDTIFWFYTDDYKKETGYESGWGDDISGGDVVEEVKNVTTDTKTGTTTAPTEVKVTEKKNADGTKETVAEVKVATEHQGEILKQAAEKKSVEIILQVSAANTKGADSVQLSLEISFVKNISDKTNADLTVNTENGKVTLDQETIKTVLAEAKGSTIVIEIAKVTKPTEVQKKAAGTNGDIFKLVVKSGDKIISEFNKGKATVCVEIPAKLTDKKVAAIHIADDGKIEQLAGKVLTIGGKKYYEFTTPHFSTFALVDAEKLGLEVEEPQVDAKALTAKLTPVARSAKTAKKNVKVTTSLDKKDKAIIKELKEAGYTVKYRFYRSTKKAAGYKVAVTKKTTSYTNTSGKKGTKYFYKVQARVYDENGKLTAKTALKQCKYASRIWTR